MISLKDYHNYKFHPHEIFISGYSGSGKTTLIEKLVVHMKKDLEIFYCKHDAHRFEMDKEGKDSQRIYAAGAKGIHINDHDHQGTIIKGTGSIFDAPYQWMDADLVLVEGYKSITNPKVLVIDEGKKILDSLDHPYLENVHAFIGPWPGRPREICADTAYFQRDDIKSIAAYLKSYLLEKIDPIPNALILAGGKSTRMGQDKAVLDYYGKPQALRMAELVKPLVDQVYISSRPGQRDDHPFAPFKILPDRILDIGPMGGIITALMSQPSKAWLVLACDLPFLDVSTIEALLDNRNSWKMATCYHDREQLAEPLSAIYESRILARLLQAVAKGIFCPRKVLLNSPIHSIAPKDPKSLTNVNYNHELLSTLKQIRETPHHDQY